MVGQENMVCCCFCVVSLSCVQKDTEKRTIKTIKIKKMKATLNSVLLAGIFSPVVMFGQIVNEAPQITLVKSDVRCFGESSGSVMSMISGGVAPYTLSWSNGESGSSLDDVTAGSYTLTVVDAVGAMNARSVEIAQPDELKIMGDVQLPSSFSAQDGSIQVEIMGGTPFKWTPYSYKFDWSNDTQTLNQNALGGGIYTLTVEDYNGCIATQDFKLKAPLPVVGGLNELSTTTMIGVTNNVYPNPAQAGEEVTITFNKQKIDYIVIIPSDGSQILFGGFDESGELKVDHLKPGSYYVKFFNGKTLVESYRLWIQE